jgi:hypothetical protein
VDRRAQLRFCVCVLVATLATGCGPISQFFHLDQPTYPAEWGKSQPYPTDNSSLDRNAAGGTSYPPNTAVQTGGVGVPGYGVPVGGQPAPPVQLPAPTPLPSIPMVPPGYPAQPGSNPAQPGSNQAQPGSNPAQPGSNQAQPAGGVPPGTAGSGMPPGDPHLRATPTAVGGRLELAPWEFPADRVVELTKQLDTLNSLNRSLLARIRELESHGATREQAIAEAVRDVERADDEVTRTRSTLQLTREEAAVLRARLQLMEKEDIETLKLVIAALEKLLDAPPSRRVP